MHIFTKVWVLALIFAAIPLTTSIAGSKWIGDINSVAGRWEGTVSTTRGSSGALMTINEDGSYADHAFNQTFEGTSTVVNGQLRFKSNTTGRMGTMTLTETKGELRLTVVTDDHSASGEFKRAK
jgi:hypothetical protein